jgi:hypothetical protein
MPPDESKHLSKGGSLLAIPACLSNWNLPIRMQRLSKERDQAIQPKEQRGSPLDSQIRPVTLRLDAQMGAPFLKRHLQTPAFHEVSDELFCRLDEVGGTDGFGRTLARWVTSQDPANRQRIVSRAIPERRPGADLHRSLPLPIPAHGERLPKGVRMLKNFLQRRQAQALDSGAANRVPSADWRGLMEDGIQSARRDEGHVVRMRMQAQFQDTGGRVTQEFDGAKRQASDGPG